MYTHLSDKESLLDVWDQQCDFMKFAICLEIFTNTKFKMNVNSISQPESIYCKFSKVGSRCFVTE